MDVVKDTALIAELVMAMAMMAVTAMMPITVIRAKPESEFSVVPRRSPRRASIRFRSMSWALFLLRRLAA
ncbi:hypothetical protein [Cryobacterium soli]|uniref:hypothetical protein n=1 Tax=Cryobacterium soli TaxID=2220095 RepID=UPI0013C46C6F|nr:hypothetical protein [Cryobacterium soli]